MKKYLPHILIGVPLLIGAVIVFGYVRRSKKMKEAENKPTTEPDTTIRTGGDTPTRTKTDDEIPLRKGSKGKYVQEIQKALGITADGDFGSITDRTVREYQKKMGLQVDGIVGKITWKSLFGTDFPNTTVRKPMSSVGGADVLTIKTSPVKKPFGKTGLTGTGVTVI
jgi:peptidoglycan hydrolase-like protein with peptidoglycan-binding domain